MKKIILAFILFLIISVPIYSQGTVIFLPLILKRPVMPNITERWKVVSPVGSTNYVMNPSAEIANNFSALGAATVTRVTTYQKFGLYSYRVQTGSNGQGISLTLSALPNENCFATARIRGRIPVRLRFIIGNSILTPLLIEKVDTNWSLYGTMFPVASCNGRTELRIIQQGNGIGDFFVDGAQVENTEFWTTYIDGDQEGCYWDGTAHAARSIRSEKSLDGGQVIDIYETYGFFVTKTIGTGMPPTQNNIDDYAILPGGELNSVKVQTRDFSLVGKFIADSEDELEINRRALHTLLKKDNRGLQLKWLVYHPNDIREIKAVYGGGLEGDAPVYYDEEWVAEGENQWSLVNTFVEPASINLKATDPYFYGVGDKVAVLDTNDTATFRLVAGRLKSTGQWNALGPPNAAGTYTSVYALAEDSTYVYMAGDFLNFDNNANADYIVRYNKSTGAYSALSTGLNGIVYALAIGPDGRLYVGGEFTNAGGVAAADYIAVWDGSSFTSLGNPNSGTAVITFVKALQFDKTGNLYIGGLFLNWMSIGNADYIVKWDGNTYTALSTGANNQVWALAVGPDNTLYLGGDFTTLGGASIARIGSWNGTTFSSMGDADATVYAIAVAPNGIVYIGGGFATIGGVSVNKIASWNGTSMSALGSGVTISPPSANVRGLRVAPDGVLWVGGIFNTAGGIALADGITRWNGYSFAHVDVDFTLGNSTVYSMLSGAFDPVLNSIYDMWVGGSFITVSIGAYGGKITATNEGSADAFPRIIFERSGGTTVTLETVRNETTGKELLLNYSLLNGERLTIDLSPSKKSVISNFYGNRQDAILPNSDFGTWILEAGNNNITSFVKNDNIGIYATEITAWLVWRNTFGSSD